MPEAPNWRVVVMTAGSHVAAEASVRRVRRGAPTVGRREEERSVTVMTETGEEGSRRLGETHPTTVEVVTPTVVTAERTGREVRRTNTFHL
jgi:hypothetical protein